MASASVTRRPRTALVYDERMQKHASPFEDSHPECPERFSLSLERVQEYGLDQRCVILPSRAATEEELQLIHSKKHVELAKSLDGCDDTARLQEVFCRFNSVYMNKHSYGLALLAAGCAIDLMKSVLSGEVDNGLAIIRPPGHHAMTEEFCGYCLFNNVAIAAKYAVEKMGLERVLIVDWDVHHGQASQYSFYTDPRVLYFSIHRYEEGNFWPELRESNWDYIGEGSGTGYNINVPLNKTGMENWDYAEILHQILLPVASEFKPQLILVSSGFDASLGDPEGEMRLTPAMYAHMTHMLKQLNTPLAVVLEGGYCLPALAEGVALVLKTLIGDPCPAMINNRKNGIREPNEVIKATIRHVLCALKPYWKCFIQDTLDKLPAPAVTYLGRMSICKPDNYPTKEYHPHLPEEQERATLQEQAELRSETRLTLASSQEVVKVFESLNGIKDLTALRVHRYLVAKNSTIPDVQALLGSACQLIIDFESHAEATSAFKREDNSVFVLPRGLSLTGQADAYVSMYSLILPLFYKFYPEWVITRIGSSMPSSDSPLGVLLSLCCGHLSCEGGLWIVGAKSWHPTTPTLEVDFTGVNATALQQNIQNAAETLNLNIDNFIRDPLPVCPELPLKQVQI
ncbi:histone deacetylase 6-like [Tropilaelaps mercedesae]|uniref:Histone deacetylase 6-like n=1 Tax=Tropilaelaps mercedesae TaxID=418985 RepID=A0A1V9XGN6_9ACAR|nr:histone deacetylase 6-like [Tropilaelaps mercedesae]